ncbi:MAG TPA: AAA family ATPase [Gaiellaceae bacterium]|nr:AAA family ATPase [Gaiellaceae bacterium]
MSKSNETPTARADSVVTTVMFIDVVRSTERAAAVGDRSWKELLEGFQVVVREEFERFGGREIDTTGDGFFARFERPAQAVRCGSAVCEAVRRLGLRVRIGLHTGECEVIGEKLGGLAVHIGARINAAAQAGEVLVSSTVTQLLAGSSLRFEDRGVHTLRGVPGEWRLFAVDQDALRAEIRQESLELIGRGEETARVATLLAEAQRGQSRALLVRGEAGIGKSSLLRYAVEQAGGMIVLQARGVESESELAFAGLGDLFRPVVDHLVQLPEPQAAALAGALGLTPPVAGDRFTICAGTLNLLAAVAEVAPVLAIVDDAQWLDTSSAEALLFAARRLDSEGVALLLGIREGEACAFSASGLDELVLVGLKREHARELLSRRLEHEAAPEVVERLVRDTQGNPLALVELPPLLSEGQLAGSEPMEDPLPAAPALERAFLRQIEALDAETRGSLLVAATSESGELDVIGGALEVLGLDSRALEPAEEAGLISVERDVLEFRHPLLRAAVYHSATGAARRQAHDALARTAAGERTDRRAWHLAAAAAELDEEVASALEQAALEARERGGHAEAALALERAARLTVDEGEQARRLFEAADDTRIAGRAGRALDLLERALAATKEPDGRARIQHLRGAIEMWSGAPMDAHRLLVEEAAGVGELDPGKAARMLTDAAWASLMAGDIRAGVETAERAQAPAANASSTTQIHAAGVLGVALLLSGRTPDAFPLLERFQPLLEAADFGRVRQLVTPAQVLTWIEEYDLARRLFTQMIDASRRQSALAYLPYPLAGLSELDFRTGNWAAAAAGAAEAIRIAEETGQLVTHAFSLVCLARVDAGMGREEDCRVRIARAREIAPSEIGAIVAYAISTLGFLELGLGRSEDALAYLELLARQVRRRGLEDPAVVQWAPDLIEAHMRAGNADDAARELEVFARQAERTQRNWALAAAARCRGLLASDDEFEESFAPAIELHARTPTPFEQARTELCLGERLRRSRRRTDARVPLGAALETFERLGAEPWAERARVELAASGEAARRPHTSASNQLTPQELQVALAVGKGATNREAGAALFLSPRTVETHLGRIYRKLDIRSRTDLARLLAGEGALAGNP